MSNATNPLLTSGLLRAAYENGIFPMAEGPSENHSLNWFQPDPRAVIILNNLHISKRLGRFLRTRPFTIKWNDDFRAVMESCATGGEGGGLRPRSESWINPSLVDAYCRLAEEGDAYCLSVFKDGFRVGGIYGVHMGGVFAAESMFSTVPNASSVALVVLAAGLNRAGVELIDVQFRNPHTARFGAHDISHAHYMAALVRLREKRVELRDDYFCFDEAISFTQSLSQTS